MDYLKDIETPTKLPFLILKCAERNYTITFMSDYKKEKKYQGKNGYMRDIKNGDNEENIKTFYRFVVSYNNLIFHIDADYLLTGCLYTETNNTSLIGKKFELLYKKPYQKSQRIYTTTEIKESDNHAADIHQEQHQMEEDKEGEKRDNDDGKPDSKQENITEQKKVEEVVTSNKIQAYERKDNGSNRNNDREWRMDMTKALENWNRIIASNPPINNAEKRADTAVAGALESFYKANPSLFDGTNIKCPLNDKYILSRKISFYLDSLDKNSLRYKFIKKLVDAAEGNKHEIKQQEIVNEETDADKIDFTEDERKEVKAY